MKHTLFRVRILRRGTKSAVVFEFQWCGTGSYDHGDASGQAASGWLCGPRPPIHPGRGHYRTAWIGSVAVPPDGVCRVECRPIRPNGHWGGRGWRNAGEDRLGVRVPGQILSSIQRLITRDVTRSTDSRPNRHLPHSAERPELIVQSAWIDPRLLLLRSPQREGGHCAS